MNRCDEVVIITHAGPSVGGGHASRCFALAQGFAAEGVGVRWLVNDFAKEILIRRDVSEEAVTVVENPFGYSGHLPSEADRFSRTILFVVDSYDASPILFELIRRLAPVALVDDCRGRPVERECDILLNYNLGAENLGYEVERAELLLGPQYALLRREFWTLVPEEGGTLLLVPGASDMLNTCERFADWWREDWPAAEFILGPLSEPDVVSRVVQVANDRPNLSIVRNPADLPMRMACSRAVICTSSVTSYEAMALRKPLIVFQTAENQTRIGKEIEQRGLGKNLGAWGSWGANKLKEAIHRLPPASEQSLVNPKGALMAAKELLGLVR